MGQEDPATVSVGVRGWREDDRKTAVRGKLGSVPCHVHKGRDSPSVPAPISSRTGWCYPQHSAISAWFSPARRRAPTALPARNNAGAERRGSSATRLSVEKWTRWPWSGDPICRTSVRKTPIQSFDRKECDWLSDQR